MLTWIGPLSPGRFPQAEFRHHRLSGARRHSEFLRDHAGRDNRPREDAVDQDGQSRRRAPAGKSSIENRLRRQPAVVRLDAGLRRCGHCLERDDEPRRGIARLPAAFERNGA